MRKNIAGKKKQEKDPIKWRGHEVTRIEAFSDAVFAFAITLLIVALEVPESYEELMHSMRFFLPFTVCFTMLFMIWYAQNIFFRRYGLRDIRTIVLNGMLIFVALFFVYPLKFLFNTMFMGNNSVTEISQIVNLYFIYSGGFMTIYILFALMYQNAVRQKEDLSLTPIEVFATRTQVYQYLLIAAVGAVSIILAAMGDVNPAFVNFSGFVYIIIGPVVSIFHGRRSRMQRRLFESETIPVEIDSKN